MKRKVLFYLIIFCALFSQINYAHNKEQSINSIAAIVNEDVITKSELDQAMFKIKMQFNQQNLSIPKPNILEKQVLDQLINKTLQLQLAKAAGIQVKDEELDKIITNIANQNHLSTSELYKRINEEGLSATHYRQEIQEQLTIQKLQQQEIASKLSVTADEVATFLQSRAWQANTGKEYHLEDILVPLPDNPTPQQITLAKEQAESIVSQLQQGQNFRNMAQAESGNPQALQGGDLGWRKLPEIPSAFAERVTRMGTKEISGPIQTPNGFHIIRLANVRHAHNPQPINRKQVQDLLLQQKLEEAIQNWISKLRAQAFIKTTSIQV